MAIDRNDFLENFVNESRENIQSLGDVIIILRKNPSDSEKLDEFLRLLHSIKGSARMMKYESIESIAHGLEDIFKGVRDQRYIITKPLIQLVLTSISHMEEALNQISLRGHDDIKIKGLLDIFQKAVAGIPYSLTQLENDSSGVEGGPDMNHRDTMGGKDYDTVRIKISKVDDIIKQLNTLIIQQFQFKRENERIQVLEQNLRETRNKIHSLCERLPELKEIDNELQTEYKMVQNIQKGYSEGMVQLEHSSFDLQELILGLRMLPLELVLDPLKTMVEETALAMNKEINLETSGTDLLLDKTILEQINDPIIHIIRNCIDHGIESSEERDSSGKDHVGHITIKCSSESGRILLRIEDDGRGLDFSGIRNKALQFYPDMEEEILEMEDSGLTSFLFRSGFTTRERITNLSGRGVGLDIVRTNIENIKGKITLSSEEGQGTVFSLSLPLSLATVDGFFVSSQDERFLIPAAFVREILIITRDEIMSILNRNAIRVRDQIIPVYPLAALLDIDRITNPEKLSVVVVESLGDIIGIIVDSVIQFSSLIYKPLPGNLVNLKVIQGVVFDENFEIINILYIPNLINRFKGIRNIEFRKRFSNEEKEFKQILVVDDSLSTREIEKSILELDGYNVEMAVDGIDALEKMRSRYFHLILTDLNMPRMDGKTLIENIRRQEKFATTPIIVVSSEADDEASVTSLGADAVFNKKDFDRGSLLQKVRNLIG
ncbi:response regulator [Oceanispirochaeta sp.]|jgi:two-component system chemotaxis sensor kinase CheA|uniref:hybrid sensor histidine kinase/response regulator n=1 Tax=Oceanispirochaeta sp. TaxID=2035350 RepID=UPI00261CC781|nr:response regulator [Oceanispirochaeta sp.]MDA3958950.1 response regulator [Oceanispirochaeta sp.]